MSNSRRLTLILVPSPPLSAVSHALPRPPSRRSASISRREGPQPSLVKNQGRSLHPFPPTSIPKMYPLLPGSTASDLPLIVFSHTRSGSGPLVSQLPRGRPNTTPSSRSRHRTPSDKGKQAAELPKPKQISPDLFLPTPVEHQKHSHTSRNRRAMKHRASVDVTSAMGWIRSTDGAESKQITEPSSRSLWAHKRGQASVGGGVWDRETRLGSANPLPEPLPERQRVMNVRRAKKMQQVFGSEPPQSLFQIAEIKPVSERDVFDDRASVSTLLSASSHLPSPRYIFGRQRPLSTSSTLIGSTPPLTPTTPVLPPLELQEPALPRFERSFRYDSSLSPPPFSRVLPHDARETATPAGTSKTASRTETSLKRKEKDFRQRRSRAAKLAKFFGVDYHDLEPHLASGEDTGSEALRVEVAVDDRGSLPWDRQRFRNLEMEDAIVRLRDLRSS